jgi:hypothetical protein
MENSAVLLWGLLFGSIGTGYCIYGKRQDNKVAWLAGIGLMFYSYFIANVFALVAIGVALMLLPRFIKW